MTFERCASQSLAQQDIAFYAEIVGAVDISVAVGIGGFNGFNRQYAYLKEL